MNRKIKKAGVLVLTVVLLALTFSSCGLSRTALSFEKNDSGYGLYRYQSVSTQAVLEIPDTYKNEPVNELMPFSIANAEYLKEVHIGSAVEKIDVWSFTNCPLLQAIHVDEANPYYKSVDGVLYNKDMTELLAYPNGKTPLVKDEKGNVTGGGEYVLPDSVKAIGENAFYLCANLYSVRLNQGLETVGNKAFLKCQNLSKLELPNTVTKIGTDAFSYCNALTQLEIPSSVKVIEDYAFFSTSSSIEKIVVRQKSADGLQLGKEWVPNKKNSIREKVEVQFAEN